MHGRGKETSNGVTYEGNFENDKKNGYGVIKHNNGDTYEGNFENDEKNGYGVLKFYDGTIYKGNFKDDKIEGFGKLSYVSGSYYEGYFEDQKFNGEGEYVHKDGPRYKGKFKNNELHNPYLTKKNQKVLLIKKDKKLFHLESLKERYNSVELFDESSTMNAAYLKKILTQPTKGDKNTKKLKIVISTHGNIHGGIDDQPFFLNTLKRILGEIKSHNSNIKSDNENNQQDVINNIDIVLNACYASNVVTKNKELQNVLKDFVKADIDVRVSAGDGEVASSHIIKNGKNLLPISKTEEGYYIINEFNFKTPDDFIDIRLSDMKKYKTEDDFMKDEYLGKVEEKSKEMAVTDSLPDISGLTIAANKDKKVNTKTNDSIDSEEQKSKKKPSSGMGL